MGTARMRKTSFLLILVGLIPLHAGSTKSVSSWFAPEAKGVKIDKFLAIVATRSVGTRRAAEDEMVSILNQRGKTARASYELLSETKLENPASAKAKLIS